MRAGNVCLRGARGGAGYGGRGHGSYRPRNRGDATPMPAVTGRCTSHIRNVSHEEISYFKCIE
jgi:hypothetical protein